MNKRLLALLGLLALSAGSTTACWLWPTAYRALPPDAFGDLSGPIQIVRIEPVAEGSVEALVEALRPWVPVPLQLNNDLTLDERHTLRWEDDLYDVDQLMDRLTAKLPRGVRVVAVTDQAMHDEEHWWLFGKGGQAAIISTAHLWADYAKPDALHPVFRKRLGKVAVHELGHCLGFSHCEGATCVMKFSTELEMLDATRPDFCAKCLKEWQSWH